MAQITGKHCKIRSKFCNLDNALSQIISNLLVKESWKLSVEKLTSQKLAYKLDPVGSTVRYEMMKLCTGSV